MIVGFRDGWLRAFFVDDTHSRNIPPDLEARLFRKLQMIDDATTDQDLRVPPSNPCQSAMAADFPLGWRARRSGRDLSGRSQLPMRARQPC